MKTKKREAQKTRTAVAAPPRTGLAWWQYAIAGIVFLYAGFQAYGPALNGPFLFDDTYLPMNMPGQADRPLLDWVKGVRPLLMFTYWLNYQSSGTDTTGYHLWNVLIHVLNSGLVFALIRRLLSLAGRERNNLLALFAAGLFLLHPVQTEGVAYIAGRSDSLATLFFLGAFALFLYRRSAAIGWGTTAGVILLSGAALASKENTVVLPALLLLTDYFFNPGFSLEGIKRNWRLYAPLVAAGALGAAFVLKRIGVADSAGFSLTDFKWYEYLFTQFRAIFVYLRLFLIPSGLTIDYDFPISHSPTEHGSIFGLIALLALLAAAIVLRKRYPLASFGLLSLLLLLAPTSSILPIRDPVAERRLYLPIIGLLLIAVEFLRRVRIDSHAAVASLGAVLLGSGALTYQRAKAWSSAEALWGDAVAKSPGKSRAHFQLAFAYFAQRRCNEAVQEYAIVAKLDKPDAPLLINWAHAYDCLGDLQQALAKLEQAAAIEPSAHVYSQIGMIHGKSGRGAEAWQALDKAKALDPNFDMTYVYRGHMYQANQDYASATREYKRALELNPKNQVAQQSLEQAAEHMRPR
ncbi:MAG: tetratricopeptide repeat protein [Bryobacteraceae bacterium]